MPTVNGGMQEIFKEVSKRIKYPGTSDNYSIDSKIFVAFVVTDKGRALFLFLIILLKCNRTSFHRFPETPLIIDQISIYIGLQHFGLKSGAFQWGPSAFVQKVVFRDRPLAV